MPKEHKSTETTRNKSMGSDNFGSTPSESASGVQQKKAKQTTNKTSKRTKWTPLPVELQPSTLQSSDQKLGRNRRRRKHKSAGGSRCRKPASPSLASICSSNSIISSSSGLGSMSSSAVTNSTHDAISTPTLPSSGCSSIGFSDDKYEDLVSERDSEIGEEETESCAETINDIDLSVAASVGYISENFDLTNPAVQQFYQEQRIIYRQFYERQFSTMACIPYSATDTSYALTSQFNHCNIQSNRSVRKNSIRNGSKNEYRKGRSARNELKPRVFYNSSNRLDNRQQNESKNPQNLEPINQEEQTEKSEPSYSFVENGKNLNFAQINLDFRRKLCV
jgi:hypothetical protein